jgi:uncharacterized membrane protein YkoI
MLQKKSSTAFLLGLSMVFSTGTFAQDSEKPVKMRDLPQAVQQTVKEQSRGASVRGLSKEVEGGNTFYEVELRINGHTKDVLIDPSGAVVEIEEEVALASVPPLVKAGIDKHSGGGKIVLVESITKNGSIVAYEAHVKTGRKYSEVKVSPDGQLITN